MSLFRCRMILRYSTRDWTEHEYKIIRPYVHTTQTDLGYCWHREPIRNMSQQKLAGHAVCSCLSFIESVELQLSLCSQTLSIYYLSIIHVHFGFLDYSFFVFEFLIISKGNYFTIRFNLDGLPMVSFAWQQILRFVWMVCMCLISSLTFKFRGGYMADLKKH